MKYLKYILILLLLLLLIWVIFLREKKELGATVLHPAYGGTGTSTTDWTGYPYITAGVWGTSSPSAATVDHHWPLSSGLMYSTSAADTVVVGGTATTSVGYALEVVGSTTIDGNLSMATSGDAYIYFNALGDYFMWDDGGDKFFFSNAISTNGLASFGSTTITDALTLPTGWTGLLRTDLGIVSTTTDDDVPEVGDFDAFAGGNYTTYDTTTNQLNLDPEIATSSFSMISEATSTYNGSVQHRKPHAYTIYEIDCFTTDAGTSTVQLDERAYATPRTGGTDVLSSALACGAIASSTAFANAGIAADAWLNLDVDSISGVNSTGTVIVNVFYYVND